MCFLFSGVVGELVKPQPFHGCNCGFEPRRHLHFSLSGVKKRMRFGHKITKLTECPHCGLDYGFYVICRMKGKGVYQYEFDGSIGDNTDLHECLEYTEQKTMYCSVCQKKIGIKEPRNR